jgi:hypothetical protein
MTVKRKTLAEAAIDVLNGSGKTDQEPMHTIEKGEVRELGGSSTSNPAGDAIGVKATELATKNTPPKGPEVESEPRKEMVGKADHPQNKVKAEVQPTMATPSGVAPLKDGAEEADHVTGEEVELTAEEIEEARVARLDMIRNKMKSISCDEDVNAMFAGTDLSEDFRVKAKTIFESAVVARAVAVVEELEKDILASAEESVTEIKEELESQVDAYLDHMVENWIKSNEVAIESGLRTEIVEEFMGGLKELFVEHNLDIPAEKVDVVEALTNQVQQLQAKVNDVLNNNVELTKKINEAKKAETIVSVCEGLTATQTEKLKTLAEGVEFTTDSEYRGKLSIIREQYFSKQVTKPGVATSVVIEEGSSPDAIQEEVSGPMASYVSAIRKTVAR